MDLKLLKNSLIIHEEKTKEITAVSVVLYVIKNHVQYLSIILYMSLALDIILVIAR